MPEIPVNSYIRNGRTVRGYRRRGRQGRGVAPVRAYSSGSKPTPSKGSAGQRIDVDPMVKDLHSGLVTSKLMVGFSPRTFQDGLRKSLETINDTLDELDELEASANKDGIWSANERERAQRLYNCLVAARLTAQAMRAQSGPAGRDAANRLLDTVEGADDRMYAMFDNMTFKAIPTKGRSTVGNRARVINFLGGELDDSGITTGAAKVIVGTKRVVDKLNPFD